METVLVNCPVALGSNQAETPGAFFLTGMQTYEVEGKTVSQRCL